MGLHNPNIVYVSEGDTLARNSVGDTVYFLYKTLRAV